MSSSTSNYGSLGANLAQDPLETQLSIKQTNPVSPHPEDPEQPRLRSSSSSSVRNSLDELNPSQPEDKSYRAPASSDSQNTLRYSRRTNRHLDPAKKLRGQFETILVYGHILEAVAAFTCLLVLFNVVVLSNRILEVSSETPQSLGNSNELIRVFGAIVYGVTVYVGLVTQLISLGFLLIMIRTRFKHNQAGVPKPDCTYSNILLITHLVVGLHWLGVASWLFVDPGYVDCFQLDSFTGTNFSVRLHRLCDLVWLVKFLAILNLAVWTSMTFFLAVFVNHYYIAFIMKIFPFLRKYAMINDILHALDYNSSSGPHDGTYAPLSGY